MDSKTAAAIDRAARQTLETVALRKAQDRINRERRMEGLEAEALDAFMRWCEGEGEEIKDPEGEAQTVWLAAWWAGREAQADEARFHYDQARAAQRRMEGLEVEGRQLYAALRRISDGMHTGDYEDAQAALAQADALISRLAERYEPERF